MTVSESNVNHSFYIQEIFIIIENTCFGCFTFVLPMKNVRTHLLNQFCTKSASCIISCNFFYNCENINTLVKFGLETLKRVGFLWPGVVLFKLKDNFETELIGLVNLTKTEFY